VGVGLTCYRTYVGVIRDASSAVHGQAVVDRLAQIASKLQQVTVFLWCRLRLGARFGRPTLYDHKIACDVVAHCCQNGVPLNNERTEVEYTSVGLFM
jgi:hypothetical protein